MNAVTWLPSFNGPRVMTMSGSGIFWFVASLETLAARSMQLDLVITTHEDSIDRIDALIDAITEGIKSVPPEISRRPWRDLSAPRTADGTVRTIWLTTAHEDVQGGGDSVVIPIERGTDTDAITDICRSGLLVTGHPDGSRGQLIFEAIRSACLAF